MARVSATSIEVRTSSVESAKAALSDLVMAWARDIETGEPRYIGEIDAEHRGGKCGCECPSCRLPLIAVNAAKDKVVRRPHFRHPEGSQREECATRAARAAAMRVLAEEGVIDLPRRRISAGANGLSGAIYEAWVEAPAQKVRVASIDFSDSAFAMLTLDDGRQLRVVLTGSITEKMKGQPGDEAEQALIPTITIDVDADIAGIDQADIRKRLKLLPGNICWQSHWNDAQLLEDAQRQATDNAIDALDWATDDIENLEGLSPSMQRESLLHGEVKRILELTGEITVPGIEIIEELHTAGHPTLERRWSVGERILRLTNTRLEYRMRPLIPDVVSDALAEDGERFDPLVIEVTATNGIDDERKERIRTQGAAALEIDLSMAGGRVTQGQLRSLVIDDVSIKRWIFYPDLDSIRSGLREQMQAQRHLQIEASRIAEERSRRIQETPITELGARYLCAVRQLLTEQSRAPIEQTTLFENKPPLDHAQADGHRRPELAAVMADVSERVDEMTQHGYPEAGDEDLLGRHRILSRLLSIQSNRGVGCDFDTAAEVLNSIRQSQTKNLHECTLYLIAVKAYLPDLSEDNHVAKWFGAWRNTVVEAVKRNDYLYMRSAKYDRLLSLLFPEMAAGLENSFGKRPSVPDLRWDKGRQCFTRSDTGPQSIFGGSDIKSWFLRGSKLEAWKLANPEAAAEWEVTLNRFSVD